MMGEIHLHDGLFGGVTDFLLEGLGLVAAWILFFLAASTVINPVVVYVMSLGSAAFFGAWLADLFGPFTPQKVVVVYWRWFTVASFVFLGVLVWFKEVNHV